MPPLDRLRRARRLRPWNPGRRSARERLRSAAASDIAGTRPDGPEVSLAMDGRWSVLLFLTTSCYGCRQWWSDLAVHAGDAGSVVVVTPSASTESARAVANLAPPGVEVVMSSEAWHDYGVRKAPWCVVVAGGVVVAHGPAPASWSGLAAVTRPA